MAALGTPSAAAADAGAREGKQVVPLDLKLLDRGRRMLVISVLMPEASRYV